MFKLLRSISLLYTDGMYESSINLRTRVFLMYRSLANVITTEIINAGGIVAIKRLDGSEAAVNFGRM